MPEKQQPIILAYSGGLDTSFCVPWLMENYARPVVTATIDTGGLTAATAAELEARAVALGASEHIRIDAREEFFEHVLRHLIAGNVRRGQVYPLCVGAERGVQATRLAQLAARRGATTVAHGCTAAGNDQVRFEIALRSVDPGLEVLAPVRDNSWTRAGQLQWLANRGLPQPSSDTAYSVNLGLWGVTIGGRETLTSESGIPEDAWVLSPHAFTDPQPAETHTLTFERGVPVALDDSGTSPVTLIETLQTLGGRFAIGRGIHLGDTVLGTKGRVAFEAPAAEILITCHRELEKLVLSGPQQRVKEQVSAAYGDLVHTGQQLDPVCRDIEALFDSAQKKVSGQVHFMLRPGNLYVQGVTSPFSLLAATRGVYGEAAGEWTPEDATGFAHIASLPGILQARADANAQPT